jgi:hypothetical protein
MASVTREGRQISSSDIPPSSDRGQNWLKNVQIAAAPKLGIECPPENWQK